MSCVYGRNSRTPQISPLESVKASCVILRARGPACINVLCSDKGKRDGLHTQQPVDADTVPLPSLPTPAFVTTYLENFPYLTEN